MARKSENDIQFNNIVTQMASKYGDKYIHIITNLLLEAGKSNTGRLIESLQTDLQKVAGEVAIQISAEDYFEYVNYGRLPGKFPNIDAIREWTEIKGIPETAVFPIAYNIFKFGIPPTGIFDNSIEQIEKWTINKLEEDLTDEVVHKIVQKILAINQETNKIK